MLFQGSILLCVEFAYKVEKKKKEKGLGRCRHVRYWCSMLAGTFSVNQSFFSAGHKVIGISSSARLVNGC